MEEDSNYLAKMHGMVKKNENMEWNVTLNTNHKDTLNLKTQYSAPTASILSHLQ